MADIDSPGTPDNKTAVWALVLGLASVFCCFLLGIGAILLEACALADRSPGERRTTQTWQRLPSSWELSAWSETRSLRLLQRNPRLSRGTDGAGSEFSWQDRAVTEFEDIDTRSVVDRTAGAGPLLGRLATGHSYQPGLLTRATMSTGRDHGCDGGDSLRLGTASHSVFSALARRTAGGHATPTSMIAVDATAAAIAGGTAVALRWREHESGNRALARFAAGASAATAVAGIGATLVAEANPDRTGRTRWLRRP